MNFKRFLGEMQRVAFAMKVWVYVCPFECLLCGVDEDGLR